MKFDVVIGNPPYQEMETDNNSTLKPLYHKFVEMARDIKSRNILFIIPSRWFSGGKGLDNFRAYMLNSDNIGVIVDYTNARDCFPENDIGGGVCYFLLDKENKFDTCRYVNIHNKNRVEANRKLNEFHVFIRYNGGISIINKVRAFKENSISDIVSTRNPFGFSSLDTGSDVKFEGALVLHSKAGIGYVERKSVSKNIGAIDKYKVLMRKLTNEYGCIPDEDGMYKVLSKMELLEKGEVCTDSYLIVMTDGELDTTQNIKRYLETKFARFLLLMAVSSVNISKDKFCFVPMQDFKEVWSDDKLYEKYRLSEEEIKYIESLVK